MARVLAFILIMTLLLALLSGCQQETPAAAAPEEPDETEPVAEVPVEEPEPVLEPEEPIAISLVPFVGRVEHIFIHPLIPYPEITFKSSQALGFDDWFITVSEFNRILPVLYERDFILVSMEDVYEEYEVNGHTRMRRKELLLPEGKKPIILSIDDLNYYKYMIEAGLVHKLVLNENGEVAAFSVNPQGEELVSQDTEVVTLLDSFVKEFPDFSHNGTKGIIALTGYEGILGYRTHAGSPHHLTERELVAPIVDRLKETGWTFASHSYGHPDLGAISYNYLVSDTSKWKREVEPLVGPTNILIYPFGSRVQEGSDKFSYLLQQGFRIFCAVGPTSYEKISTHHSAVMTDRRHVDGLTFRKQRERFLDLYDSNDIIDLEVRPIR